MEKKKVLKEEENDEKKSQSSAPTQHTHTLHHTTTYTTVHTTLRKKGKNFKSAGSCAPIIIAITIIYFESTTTLHAYTLIIMFPHLPSPLPPPRLLVGLKNEEKVF